MCEDYYTDVYHSAELKKHLFNYLLEGTFGDVEIRTADSNIFAHKVILSSMSLYLRTQFTSNIGNDETKRIVNLIEFDSSAVREILKFMYIGSVKVTWDNIFVLMQLEELLQVSSLRGILSTFLQSFISKNYCWVIKQQADFFHYADVSDAAMMFIRHNFKTLIREEQFLKVPYKLLKECLDFPVLATPTEGILLCNLVSWVMDDYIDRGCYFEELLIYVDPSEITSWDDSVKIVRNLTEKTMEASCIMDKWLDAALEKRKMYIPSYNPRYKHLTHPGLLAIGGRDSEGCGVASVEVTMDVAVGTWRFLLPVDNSSTRINMRGIELPLFPLPRAAFAATTAGPFHSYIMGGLIDDGDITDRVDIYSVLTNSWQEGPNLPYCVYHGAAAYLDHSIYLSGGLINHQPSKSFIMLPKGRSCWKHLAPMTKERSHHCLVSCRGAIYALGGLDADNCVLSSVEKYDPVSNTWTFVAPMNFARHSFVAASPALSSLIYIIRGLPVYECRPTVEKYSARDDIWKLVQSGRSGAMESWAPVFGGLLGTNIAMVSQGSRNEASSTITVFHTVSGVAMDHGKPLIAERWGGALIPISIPLYKLAPI